MMMQLDRQSIHLIHFLVVAPLLVYVGQLGLNGQAIPENLYQLLFGLGVLAMAYHGYRYCNLTEGMLVTKEKDEEIVPIN